MKVRDANTAATPVLVDPKTGRQVEQERPCPNCGRPVFVSTSPHGVRHEEPACEPFQQKFSGTDRAFSIGVAKGNR
jgi:ribosomal protein S27AE